MCWLTVNPCGANTFPSLRTPWLSSYETWVCDIVKRVLYFSTQSLLFSIIFHCKTWVCLRSVGDSLYKKIPDLCNSAFMLNFTLSKMRLLGPLPSMEKWGWGYSELQTMFFFVEILLKKFYFSPWRNLYIIFSSRVSQDQILTGKRYMCYHLALIYHLNTHAVAMSFTQQWELQRMALDGVSWVPFQLSSTFITLWPWLSYSTFFLWVSTERWEMNRDDMCKIHVLWEKGGCCVNLIVRHE